MPRRGNPRHRPWTDDEDRELRELWEQGPLAAPRFVETHPWRTVDTARARLGKLGLSGRAAPYRSVGYVLDVWQWAYVAGIIDGEGGFYMLPAPQACVTNTNVDLLDLLDGWLPGGKRYLSAGEGFRRTKPCFFQRWSSWHHAFHICAGTLPYLVVKREPALIILNHVAEKYGLAYTGSN